MSSPAWFYYDPGNLVREFFMRLILFITSVIICIYFLIDIPIFSNHCQGNTHFSIFTNCLHESLAAQCRLAEHTDQTAGGFFRMRVRVKVLCCFLDNKYLEFYHKSGDFEKLAVDMEHPLPDTMMHVCLSLISSESCLQ